MVMASGEAAEFFVNLFEEAKDRLIEIIASRYHAVHVVLLVLHRAEENWILEVHHFRHAAPLGAEQLALGRSWAVNELVRSPEKFTQQVSFGRQVGALGMGREHAVLDVHARVE